MKEKPKIKVGVVGAGHLGKFHIQQYQLIGIALYETYQGGLHQQLPL